VRPRFYVPDLDPAAERVALPADEAEHLARVLRLGVGAEVDAIDGHGGLWRAEVVRVNKRSATVRLIERGQAEPESRVPITLVSSVLKADKMDGVVRDAVMLGVTAIQPIVTERAEVTLSAIGRGHRVARWRRIAVASIKQCGRAVLPPVAEAVTLDAYLARPTAEIRLVCVEPSADDGARSVHDVPKNDGAHIIVGPEGGWSPAEIATMVKAGVILMSLGRRTLRADAAPIVALTALLTAWREL
jgi:16S rRNA (uracil1498-N3)-methyltransferase